MAEPHMLETATIVAIATAPGRGGIGVVRLSGPEAHWIALLLFHAHGDVLPRVATYGVVTDADGARVDDGVLTLFVAPHSYTGEDVAEIAVHGSPVVLEWVVRAAVERGAQPARAGEFTERAFLSGRIDLTAAEAVRDLIDAQTLMQAQVAAQQMCGAVSAAVAPAKEQLLQLIAALEAGIDFAEDDIDTMGSADMAERIAGVDAMLQPLLLSFARGRLLREGVRLAIVGRPNAGKSSLFNRLLQKERAIVTATPGTTRDVIAERLELDGIPVELLDTAGLRETEDEAERMGVERTRVSMADADVVMLVVDATRAVEDEDAALLQSMEGRAVVVVRSKCDLASAREGLGAASIAEVHTSAATGEGIEDLRRQLLRVVRGGAVGGSSAVLTNLRQRDAVARSAAALERAGDAVAMPHEMVLLDLHEALSALDELTGQTTPDDVLARIFSSFCIGK